MAEILVLEVQERTKSGTNAAKQVRKNGLVPAVIYGHGEPTASLSIPGDALYKAIRHGVRIFDVKLGGATQMSLLRDVQWDPLGHDILHADFYRVRADEKITLVVKVELRGTAPGVTGGGVLVQQIHSLSVECLIVNIPESIRVNIGELQLDQAIHVKELVLPEGVVVKNDPEAIIVQVAQKVIEEVAAPVAGVPGATPDSSEPEVIGRVKGEEDEGDDDKEKKDKK